MDKKLIKLAGAAIGVIPLVIYVRDNVFDIYTVIGVSMQPTINPEFPKYERVLVNKAITYSNLKRGDVVAVASPNKPRMLLKRLVALENDWVVREGGMYTHIPAGHCWVEGDNRSDSIDSNVFGPVPVALIKATVPYVIWPPKNIRRIKSALNSSVRSRVTLRPYS